MLKGVFIFITIMVVFFVALIVTMSARKRRVKQEANPLMETMHKYQEKILDNGYDITFTTQPTNMPADEILLYQTLAKISNVDFDIKNPESEQIVCNVWISETNIIVNSKKESVIFAIADVKEFEFELKKANNDILFVINDEYIKISTKDLYFVALLELLIRKHTKAKII